MNPTRTRILRVSVADFAHLFTGAWHHAVLTPPLPADARLLSVAADWQTNEVSFLIESAEFEEVLPGCQPLAMAGHFVFQRADWWDSFDDLVADARAFRLMTEAIQRHLDKPAGSA